MNSTKTGDFYLLPFADHEAKTHFVCKLTEKALHQGHQIYIHCSQPSMSEEMDSLLYSFRADSFLPHHKISAEQSSDLFERSDFPILVGSGQQQTPEGWVVINLGEEPYLKTQRVAEIVLNDEASKSLSRSKFTLYKKHQFSLRTHQL